MYISMFSHCPLSYDELLIMTPEHVRLDTINVSRPEHVCDFTFFLAAFFRIWNLVENVVGSEIVKKIKRELYFWAKNNVFSRGALNAMKTIYTTVFSDKNRPRRGRNFLGWFFKGIENSEKTLFFSVFQRPKSTI